MNDKKITLLVSSLSGGGAEGVCVNIANGLVNTGWQVDLVILHTNDAFYLDRVNEKVNLTVLGVHHARQAGFPLLNYIRGRKPQKILVFNYELAVLAIILRGVFRFKSKIISRNINTYTKNTKEIEGDWSRYIIKQLINYFYVKSDHIINQCQAMQVDLLSVFPKLSHKTSVIYNPVAKHIEDYAKLHDLLKLSSQNYLLCVGRLEKQKGFHSAIEAFACIASDFPDLRLKIVGQGSLECELKKLSRNLGVATRVDFEGFQSDIISYYINAKITLLTSLYEGFPNVLIESISLGTPIIAFDCPSGPREIIHQGVNGYLVENQNVDKLVELCKKLLLDNIDKKSILLSSNIYCSKVVIEKYEEILSD
ncbi:glycosyltransferase, putative [Aliivibrio fischeri MJ11]|uniref:Glycosyltransferase, putative n=1 Tax=Aliivibrio fischeri (strain MJ11) TaxID=388396 RepID=B5FFW7_ALIFM|nr:glycosyltransferase [Aliivibrio fischeri]ACH64912.1 glycosyltransferase, putative [Aliivibrio fischeri MJ11]